MKTINKIKSFFRKPKVWFRVERRWLKSPIEFWNEDLYSDESVWMHKKFSKWSKINVWTTGANIKKCFELNPNFLE